MKRPGVAIYHRVKKNEDFEKSAKLLFQLVHKSKMTNPGKPRVLYLDIDGHRNEEGGFDEEMYSFQKDFIIGYLMNFLTEIHIPLVTAKNSQPQSEELPNILRILPGGIRKVGRR